MFTIWPAKIYFRPEPTPPTRLVWLAPGNWLSLNEFIGVAVGVAEVEADMFGGFLCKIEIKTNYPRARKKRKQHKQVTIAVHR